MPHGLDPTRAMHIPLRTAIDAVPDSATSRFAALFAHGSLAVEFYAPRGTDAQRPHWRDELYVVGRGHATFVTTDRTVRCEPGDVLFVAAGVPHRFEAFSADFGVRVFFYGPDGGEDAVRATGR